MRGVAWRAIVVSGILAAGASTRALAAPYCVPAAVGVPGAAGAPTWWGGAASAVDDPRWRGAATFEDAAGQMRFRALVDGSGADRSLLLSWQVVNDPTAGDDLYFGFFDTGAGQGNIFRLTRLAAAGVDGGVTAETGATFNATTVSTEAWYWTGTAWSLVSGLPHFPSWLGDDGRLDVSCSSTACDAWTVRLRVPLVTTGGDWASPTTATGLQLPTTFKLFYEIKSVANQLTPPYSALEWDDPAVDLTDPTNFTDENALGAPRFPAVAGWPTVGLDPTDPTCVRGISFDASTVKVVNAGSGAGGGARIDLTGANTFHLEPVNDTGTTRAQGLLLAALRISDWGPAQYAAPTWRPLPGCAAATGGAGTVANGVADDLTCTWTPSTDERCAYDAALGCSSTLGVKFRYQCYFIELRTASSALFYPSGSDVFCEAPPSADGGAPADASSPVDAGAAPAEAGAPVDAGASGDARATADARDGAVTGDATTIATDAPANRAGPSADGPDSAVAPSDAATLADAATPSADAAGPTDARTTSKAGSGGCGCALDASPGPTRPLGILALGALIVVGRRRRR